MMLLWIGAGGLAYVLACGLRGALCALMVDAEFVAPNYRNERIPKGLGILIPLAAILPIGALVWIDEGTSVTALWLALLFGMGFLGLLDDTAGEGSHGGFHQHFKALFAGRATTGGLKALFGGALSLYAGWLLSDSVVRALIAASVIALSTNAINLLDVRPGRALKGFALLMTAGAIGFVIARPLEWHTVHQAAGAAVVGAAAALWAGDHRAAYMLGDAGSNVLGACAGLWLAAAPLGWQLTWLLLLLALHLYSERHSITETIERVALLNRIDRWGRSGS